MKKILVIHPSLGYGGAEKMMAFVANSFAEENEVDLLLLQEKEITLELNSNIRVEQYDLYPDKAIIGKGMLSGLFSFGKMTKAIRRVIKEKKPDIVFGFDLRVLVATYIATKKQDVKFIFSERADPFIHSSRWRTIIKHIYRKIDYIVFQTEGARSYYGKIVDNKSSIIPNPAIPRNNAVEEAALEFDYPYIFSAGQMQWRKGFDILIKAYEMLHKELPDYHLVLFGEGSEREELIRLTKDCGLIDTVHFFDAINNVIERNAKADLFVLPSRSEGIPNIMIEAMYAEMPCVAANCSPGGAALLSNDGKYCLLCERDNVFELYKAILFGLRNRAEMIKMAHEAKKSLSRFNKEAISLEWKQIINKVSDGTDGE